MGHTTKFHRYLDLPDYFREMIRDEAIDQAGKLARLATVSREWQEDIEELLFFGMEIDPSVEDDVLMFKQVFKDKRRQYLDVLHIIVNDQPIGPGDTANRIVHIIEATGKVGIFFDYLKSWGRKEVSPYLEIRVESSDWAYLELDVVAVRDLYIRPRRMKSKGWLDWLVSVRRLSKCVQR